MIKEKGELRIKIKCINLPGTNCGEYQNIRLGIQRNKEVINDVPGDADEVIFEIPISTKLSDEVEECNFAGPFVHGKSGEKFIYLSWGQRNGNEWIIVRRAKILLNKLTKDTIVKATKKNKPVEIEVNMTDDKGGHLCASIKDKFIKWKLPK